MPITQQDIESYLKKMEDKPVLSTLAGGASSAIPAYLLSYFGTDRDKDEEERASQAKKKAIYYGIMGGLGSYFAPQIYREGTNLYNEYGPTIKDWLK